MNAFGLALIGANAKPAAAVAGALASLDFKNGAYAIGGVSKTLAEVVTEDLNFGNFTASDVVAGVGLRAQVTTASASHFVSPVLTAAAVSGLLIGSGGCTTVMTYSLTGDVSGGGGISIGVEQGDFVGYMAEAGFLHRMSTAGDPKMWDYGGNSPVMTAGAGPIYKAAFTLTSGKLVGSIDGNAVQSRNPSSDNSAVATFGMTVRVSNPASALTKTAVLEKIEFFAVADDAALPTLSTP